MEAIGERIKVFDAFPKVEPEYARRSRSLGDYLIYILPAFLILLIWMNELISVFNGVQSYAIDVDTNVHEMMIVNLDMVIAMPCAGLLVNVMDVTGEYIMATNEFRLEGVTSFDASNAMAFDEHERRERGHEENQFLSGSTSYGLMDVHEDMGHDAPACRIVGQTLVHMVQGDLHITSRGHGYQGKHWDHSKMNFTHVINDLSFGPYFQNIERPLTSVLGVADTPFHRFQYFTTLVRSVFRTPLYDIETFQYSAAAQSRSHTEHRVVPGIFFRYDIEPLLLTVSYSNLSVRQLMLRTLGIFGFFAGAIEFFWKLLIAPRLSAFTIDGGEGILGVAYEADDDNDEKSQASA